MIRTKVFLFTLAVFAAAARTAAGAEGAAWSFDGLFGRYDDAQLRRGFTVFETACQSCHSLKYIAYRHLRAIGLTEEALKAMAAAHTVADGLDEAGGVLMRGGRLEDHLPMPFASEAMARAVNGGSLPPDLSLIVKAREGGSDYIYALLQGYDETAAAGIEVPEGKYYNKAFEGHVIAMPRILWGQDVVYEDGTAATAEQEAADVAAFLTWTAYPELNRRKAIGFWVLLYTVLLSVLLGLMKHRLWRKVS